MKDSIIIKFDFIEEQKVGGITKIVGLVKAKYLIPVIDSLDLEANPRSSETGAVTEAIRESIINDSLTFPFKTKGVLLASSQYERLERGRIRITPSNPEIEGILDGGHNMLAIGLYILESAFGYANKPMPKGKKTWNKFKELWQKNRSLVTQYLLAIDNNPDIDNLGFLLPVELLIPSDEKDKECVDAFCADLLEICAARNNNVQLPNSDKANKQGYFDDLKQYMELRNPAMSSHVEWKTNDISTEDSRTIKAQDIVALTWIPLGLISPVTDDTGRQIEAVSPAKIYSSKGVCMKQFERLMSSPEVTLEGGADYRRKLINPEVDSALRIAAELPELYDHIYATFPDLYNKAGGNYGRIIAVNRLNKTRKDKSAPFSGDPVAVLSPDGFIVPLVYGLQALMERQTVGDHSEILWRQQPMPFLIKNLPKIVEAYVGIFSICGYDPQKIGKSAQSYVQTLSAFKMAIANIL